MADAPSDPPPEKPKTDFQLPSLKKIREFLFGVMRLEQSVEALKKENRKLQEQVSRLQEQVIEQGGQLKVLLHFVDRSVGDQVELRAEKAASQTVERLVARQGINKPQD